MFVLMLSVRAMRLVEHAFHVGDSANVPLGQVLVEVTRLRKYHFHVRVRVSVRVRVRVKVRFRVTVTLRKHQFHGADFANVPLGQVLVEDNCSSEHALHVGDAGDIPIGQVLVE